MAKWKSVEAFQHLMDTNCVLLQTALFCLIGNILDVFLWEIRQKKKVWPEPIYFTTTYGLDIKTSLSGKILKPIQPLICIKIFFFFFTFAISTMIDAEQSWRYCHNGCSNIDIHCLQQSPGYLWMAFWSQKCKYRKKDMWLPVSGQGKIHLGLTRKVHIRYYKNICLVKGDKSRREQRVSFNLKNTVCTLFFR